MITTDREYRITGAAARRFEEELRKIEGQSAGQDPLLFQAMRDSIVGELNGLRAQLSEYEALRSGQITVFEADSLTALPTALIKARIARGLTQKDLAECLGLKMQQIQRYEATLYSGASLERTQEVAEALGVIIYERVILSNIDAGAPPDGAPGGVVAQVTPRWADVLHKTKLTLRNIAASMIIPNSVMVKIRRAEIDPATIPDRFLGKLANLLGLDLKQVSALIVEGRSGARLAHLRSDGPPAPKVEQASLPFRDALARATDLTLEHRREWLESEV